MLHGLSSLPSRADLPPPPTELRASVSVTADPARDLIRYTLAGFFDPAGIAEVKAAQAAAARQLRCGVNRHVTLLDISGCKIQSRATMARFAEMLDDDRHRGRALAVVVGGSLARGQVGRIVARDNVAYFATVAEAERWLFAAAADQPRASAPTASATDANPSRDRHASSSAAIRAGNPGPA